MGTVALQLFRRTRAKLVAGATDASAAKRSDHHVAGLVVK